MVDLLSCKMCNLHAMSVAFANNENSLFVFLPVVTNKNRAQIKWINQELQIQETNKILITGVVIKTGCKWLASSNVQRAQTMFRALKDWEIPDKKLQVTCSSMKHEGHKQLSWVKMVPGQGGIIQKEDYLGKIMEPLKYLPDWDQSTMSYHLHQNWRSGD